MRYLQLSSIRDFRKTLRQLTAEFNLPRKDLKKVGRLTVARALSRTGLLGQVAPVKPLLRPINIKNA